MKNIIGPRVKLARNRFTPRMTQQQLAARLQIDNWDIDRSGVAKIEMGLRRVTDIELLKLAAALSVSTSWLLGEIE